jgi:hypothetical protein
MANHSNASSEGHRLELWLAFAFGVIFVGVMLYLATVVKNPEPYAVKIYLTVVALAGAGVAAILPGFLMFRYKGFVRASGSLAVFALLYFNAPAIGSAVVRVVPPIADPMPLVGEFFTAVDSGNPQESWGLLSPSGRELAGSESEWASLYATVLAPLGKATKRELVGRSASQTQVPGLPPGAYTSFMYRTKFANDRSPRAEAIVLRGNESEKWEVFSYQVSLATIN